MNLLYSAFIVCLFSKSLFSQSFKRSELPTSLSTPWELTFGPDNYLWVTEFGGKVSRVDPSTGTKTVVYVAPDYYGGGINEQSTFCTFPNIGFGTLGLALHPDFLMLGNSYIYYLYSYNSGTIVTPITRFKVVRLTWDPSTKTVISSLDLITQLPNGYDHLGGRVIAVKQGSVNYLYVSSGDNGISETNAPTCYIPQSNNPNNFVEDPNYKNGKIHRFNIDGTIPIDNPISGNSFFSRGHRNPQGLIYNTSNNLIYDIEHGDRTDDEINILQAGMNYGWKNVRGYHYDNNFAGELAYVSSYIPNPLIAGDKLIEPIYSWCATPQPSTSVFGDWCTVAPSDGIYYGSNGIPNWNNSLLVVTLKKGVTTNPEVYQFKLNPNGLGIVPSTALNPNPNRFFGSDQAINGRLRDITISSDGKIIYLVNNGGTLTDKIIVYTYQEEPISVIDFNLIIYPNPTSDSFMISCNMEFKQLMVFDMMGKLVYNLSGNTTLIDASNLSNGIYTFCFEFENHEKVFKKVVVE